MRFPSFAAVAALASAAVATASPNVQPFLGGGVHDKRDLSPEAIKCHKTCGYTIQGATKEGYCDDATWKQLEQRCSECAPTQDNIATTYHDKLKTALEPCGLDPPPTSSAAGQSSSASSSSAAAQSATSASVQPVSTGQEGSGAAASPSSSSLDSGVSSAPDSVTSTASASATSAAKDNASTGLETASASSASKNHARGSQAVPFGRVALLFAAALLR